MRGNINRVLNTPVGTLTRCSGLFAAVCSLLRLAATLAGAQSQIARPLEALGIASCTAFLTCLVYFALALRSPLPEVRRARIPARLGRPTS